MLARIELAPLESQSSKLPLCYNIPALIYNVADLFGLMKQPFGDRVIFKVTQCWHHDKKMEKIVKG
jgi:hypothetical protein